MTTPEPPVWYASTVAWTATGLTTALFSSYVSLIYSMSGQFTARRLPDGVNPFVLAGLLFNCGWWFSYGYLPPNPDPSIMACNSLGGVIGIIAACLYVATLFRGVRSGGFGSLSSTPSRKSSPKTSPTSGSPTKSPTTGAGGSSTNGAGAAPLSPLSCALFFLIVGLSPVVFISYQSGGVFMLGQQLDAGLESSIKQSVGFASMAGSVLLFGAPLTELKNILHNKYVARRPIRPLLPKPIILFFSVASTMMWTLYGLLMGDSYITVPNGLGLLLNIVQAFLFVTSS